MTTGSEFVETTFSDTELVDGGAEGEFGGGSAETDCTEQKTGASPLSMITPARIANGGSDIFI